MCLSTITQIFEPNDDITMGYKIYHKNHSRYEEHYRCGIRKAGTHYKARKYGSIRSAFSGDYDVGFHLFVSLEKTKKYKRLAASLREYTDIVICRVLAWDIRAKGIESALFKKNVIIAKNIMIMEEV